MKIKFTKMHGLGNDYVVINDLECLLENFQDLSISLSDRHFGIGSNGVIFVLPSDCADAKMKMFNPDGSESEMCGNGIRCFGKFLYDNKLVKNRNITAETLSGIKTLEILKSTENHAEIKVNMGFPILSAKMIPVEFNNYEKVINEPIEINNILYKITCVSVGNPHCILFFDEIQTLNLKKLGPEFEKNKIFPQRTNVEFIRIIDEKIISMRVWERGVGETLACGSGACASVVAAVENGFCKKNCNVTVKLSAGNLIVNYSDDGIYMTGEAKKVFAGEIKI